MQDMIKALPHLFKDAACIFGFGELPCIKTIMLDKTRFYIDQKQSVMEVARTRGIQHALDNGADHGGVSQDDKFESIARDKSDVFANVCHYP